MGIILKKLTLYGSRGKRTVGALFDSGSTHSFVRKSVVRELGVRVELPEPRRFEMVRGNFTVREAFVGEVLLGRHRAIGTFLVLDGLNEELIIGADFLQVWHIRLEPRRKRVILDPRAFRLRAGGGRLLH